MKTMENFSNWFIEHDKHIMEDRLKREKNILNKELGRLEDIRDRMRDHLHRLEDLVEKQEELASTLSQIPKGGD